MTDAAAYYVALTGEVVVAVADILIRLPKGDSLSVEGSQLRLVEGDPLFGPLTKDEFDLWQLRHESTLYPSVIANGRESTTAED